MTGKKNIECTIMDSIDEGIVTLEKGFIRHVNSAFERMTGSSASEIIGQTLGAFVDLPPVEANSMEEHHTGVLEKMPAHEVSLKTATATSCDVAVSRHEVSGSSGKVQIVIVRDIAERKKMQQELLKARHLESIAALSGGIAHDYNNLLTAIMGNISLALTGIPEDDAIYDWLSQAQEAALIAKELTNRLITFSKGGAPQKETVDIAGLVEGVTAFALSGSNIVAEFDIASDLWCADVDRTQIGQAFHNLVINAREAMPEGGTLFVSVANQTAMPGGASVKSGRFVAVSIKDTGSGIPPGALGRIFDPYFSTKDMGGPAWYGTGIVHRQFHY